MSKIAIVGATGNYGGKAIESLLQHGINPNDIVAIYRNEEKAAQLKELGLEISYGDYQSGHFNPEVFKGAEKLLFISGIDMDSFKRIQDHMVVIEAARKAGIQQIVYTGLAYPHKAKLGMEDVHLATEHAIKASGISYTFLRNTYYTEYFIVPQEMKRAVESGKLYSLAQGRSINFVSRNDMAKAAAVVLTSDEHLNKIYEITAPKAYSYQDIADTLTEVSGKNVAYVETNIEAYGAYLDEIGVPKEFQMWDSGMMQPGFANGWGENTDSALADLIGAENIKTPKQIIQEMDLN